MKDNLAYEVIDKQKRLNTKYDLIKTVLKAVFLIFLLLNIGYFLLLAPFLWTQYYEATPEDTDPLVIAHRGSSGMRPEHTIEAYQLAVQQNADMIECDVAVTKDLKLVCSHDPGLNLTTDVHQHPQFQDRVRTYLVDGIQITDYFIIDFTLADLMTLRKNEGKPYRDQEYNGLYKIASFDDYIFVAKHSQNRKKVGIYPETKNPDFYNMKIKQLGSNLTMEDLLLDSLERHGYTKKTSYCFLQSFSLKSLKYLSEKTELRLVWLRDTKMTQNQIWTAKDLCYAVGVDKNLIIQVDPIRNRVNGLTSLVSNLHSVGLKVHVFTFRNEPRFLAWDYGSDPYMEYEEFFNVDGIFTDFPLTMVNYLLASKCREKQ